MDFQFPFVVRFYNLTPFYVQFQCLWVRIDKYFLTNDIVKWMSVTEFYETSKNFENFQKHFFLNLEVSEDFENKLTLHVNEPYQKIIN